MSKGLKTIAETRAGDVLQRMRADIISCSLKPGTKLRFEGLREVYEASFSTLREALSRLVAEGLVISADHRGFVVAPVTVSDLEDLTNVRVLIEKECLALAIANGDDRWEADILSTFHRMDRLQERLGSNYYLSEEWAKLHGDFHFSLVVACRSSNLLTIRQQFFERAHRYRRMSSQFRKHWRPKDVEHRTIMDATIARNKVAASDLIERHIRETTDNLLKYAQHIFEVPDEGESVSTKIA